MAGKSFPLPNRRSRIWASASPVLAPAADGKAHRTQGTARFIESAGETSNGFPQHAGTLEPGSGVATPLMNTGRTGTLSTHRAGTPAAGRTRGPPAYSKNGKIDPALHDGMRTGLRQLQGTGSSPAALPKSPIAVAPTLNRTVASRHRKSRCSDLAQTHHQFRGESRNTLAGAGNHAMTSSSTSCAGSTYPTSGEWENSEDKRAYQATFSTETSASGGSASSPTPVYSGSCPGFAECGGGNKAIRAHHHQRSIVLRDQLRRRPCVSPTRSTPSWLSVRYEFALPAPPE